MTRLLPLRRPLLDRVMDAATAAVWRARWVLLAAAGFVAVFDAVLLALPDLPPRPGATVTVDLPAPLVAELRVVAP